MTGGGSEALAVASAAIAPPRPSREGLGLAPSQLPVARAILDLAAEARVRAGADRPAGPLRYAELRARLLRRRVFEDPGLLVGRLKRRGLLVERAGVLGSRAFDLPYPDELDRLLREAEVRSRATTGPPGAAPMEECQEIGAMDGEFRRHLRGLLKDRLASVLEFGRRFDVDQLTSYLQGLFGEPLAFEPLVALLQQYGLADAPLLAPNGRVTGGTGFHLALFGPPGTGKTFAIDDLVRGNPRTGVPPHGLPGRNRFCGGITPAQFLRLGAAYVGRTFNFIVPEFNDWFRYRGMVEPLKLVMEQREVKWETTFGTVGPYTFRSFFSVNYNVRTGGEDGVRTTIADPNFAALEDRMLLRFQPMSAAYFRAIEASSERLELGELDFERADALRDHLTLVHAIATGDPLVTERFPARPVALERRLYERLHAVSERALRDGGPPLFSPRLRGRAVRLAAASALVASLAEPDDGPIRMGPREIAVAERFYAGEIAARRVPEPPASRSPPTRPAPRIA